MKNNYTSPFGLPFLSNLKQERERKIDSLINNLQLADVEKEEAYNKTVERIKSAVQLPPVQIGAGKYVRHEFEQKDMSFQQQLIGGPSSLYHHEIAFPVTGTADLIAYTPETPTSYSASESGLILPIGRQITVYVSLPQLENEKAVAEADKKLDMTKRYANANNASITSWNGMVGTLIDQKSLAKRKELIEKFSGK